MSGARTPGCLSAPLVIRRHTSAARAMLRVDNRPGAPDCPPRRTNVREQLTAPAG
ncbi:hypothetical protein ACH4CD_01510 [Streptomyces fungicidicus]|uniref:hypothetical protein n=1 Tax=Streptomyces fungicidicus TaxID=68203 RepID=UPI00379FBE67